MAFGDKIKRTCVTCGKEFEGFPQSKYCSDTCKPKRDRNKKKEPNQEAENDTSNTDIVKLGADGTIDNSREPDNRGDRKDDSPDNNISTDPSDSIQTSSVNSIQIIDSNTGKKEKGIVDQVLEKLLSDDLAPITTSILASIATRLQQPNNTTEEGILTAEDGSKHAMI